MRLRWYRYQAVVIGCESGNRSPLPFIRFRTREQGLAWLEKMGREQPDNSDLTRYDVEEIPR